MVLETVLQGPILSEKSTRSVSGGVYTFLVNKRATKREIKRAVEQFYLVHVTAVRTLIRRGKRRVLPRFRHTIARQDVKVAYVTLKSGEKIDIFEEAKQ